MISTSMSHTPLIFLIGETAFSGFDRESPQSGLTLETTARVGFPMGRFCINSFLYQFKVGQ